MSIDTTLARLTAGLDEDERMARAAAERSAEWRSDGKGVDGGPFTPADPEWGMAESGEHTIVYDEGYPLEPEAVHIAAHDPASVLRTVEAIRAAVEESRRYVGRESSETGDVGYEAYVQGHSDACERILSALAGIYTEPTEEKP